MTLVGLPSSYLYGCLFLCQEFVKILVKVKNCVIHHDCEGPSFSFSEISSLFLVILLGSVCVSLCSSPRITHCKTITQVTKYHS